MVVVLPLPLTPQTRTTCGRFDGLISKGFATGANISVMSAAKASRTSSSVTSLSNFSRARLAVSLAAVATPRSEVISKSSNSWRVAASSFFLVNSAVIPPTSLSEVRDKPDVRRWNQPLRSGCCSSALMPPDRQRQEGPRQGGLGGSGGAPAASTVTRDPNNWPFEVPDTWTSRMSPGEQGLSTIIGTKCSVWPAWSCSMSTRSLCPIRVVM